jgi:hypothetical protein
MMTVVNVHTKFNFLSFSVFLKGSLAYRYSAKFKDVTMKRMRPALQYWIIYLVCNLQVMTRSPDKNKRPKLNIYKKIYWYRYATTLPPKLCVKRLKNANIVSGFFSFLQYRYQGVAGWVTIFRNKWNIGTNFVHILRQFIA